MFIRFLRETHLGLITALSGLLVALLGLLRAAVVALGHQNVSYWATLRGKTRYTLPAEVVLTTCLCQSSGRAARQRQTYLEEDSTVVDQEEDPKEDRLQATQIPVSFRKRQLTKRQLTLLLRASVSTLLLARVIVLRGRRQ